MHEMWGGVMSTIMGDAQVQGLNDVHIQRDAWAWELSDESVQGEFRSKSSVMQMTA